MSAKIGQSVGVTGNVAWSFAGKHGRENYYWSGPGSRLYLLYGSGGGFKPGDGMTPIDHHLADGNYRTRKEASEALRRYLGVSKGRRR